MPFLGTFHIVVAVALAIHAMRTGRPYYWLLILLMVPFIGSLAYILVEIVPELANSRRARQTAGNVRDIIDPNREWRRRREEAEQTDSVDAKRLLAEECERKGMWQDAAELYEAATKGIFADEPALLVGLARAQLELGDPKAALASLDRLRAAHPKLEHAEGHLVYARVQEALGNLDEAEREYAAVSRSYIGLEARTRYALLLLRRGKPTEARPLFQDVARVSGTRGIVLSPADKEWAKVAKANL